MKKSSLNRIREKLVWIVLASIFFYIILILISDVNKISENFSNIRIELVFLVLGIQLLSHFVKSLRQSVLLNKLNVRIKLKQNFLIYLAGMSLVATPGGIGTFVKLYFLKQKLNIIKSDTFTVVFLERYHDLLAASTIILVTIFISFGWLPATLLMISAFLLSSVFFLMKNFNVFIALHKKMLKIKLIARLMPFENPNTVSFDQLTKPMIMVKGWGISVLGWSLDAFSIYIGFLAFGVDLGFFMTTQIYFTSIGYGILSFLPGGIGVTEGVGDYLLVRHGLELAIASSLVIFTRLTTIWFITILGIIFTRSALR